MKSFKLIFVAFVAVLLATAAYAGFRAYDEEVLIGAGVDLRCGANISCVKQANGVLMSVEQEQESMSANLTLTSAMCGSSVINSGSFTATLPEASANLGCRFTFIVGAASELTIDPDDADQIVLLTNAAGDSLVADAIGESVVLEAISASAWAPVGAEQGTWTDSN